MTLSLRFLSADEIEAVQLRYWDGLSVVEIAELLQCTPNAISMRLHKARRKTLAELERKDLVRGGHVSGDPGQRTEDCSEH